MTQPPVRPTLFPMSKETEAEFYESLTQRLDEHYTRFASYLDDNIDGFHKKPPRERILLYQASEPVFDPTIPEPMIELFLEQGAYEPLIPVYDHEGLIRPPVMVQPEMGAQPATPGVVTPAMTTPALLGMAPAILGPWWQRMWAVDRVEALKCLRDYRDISRRKLNDD
jgi:hypothetical protein